MPKWLVLAFCFASFAALWAVGDADDFYAVLGVARNATAEDITKAFKDLAKRWHPEKNPGNAEAEKKFQEIAVAYRELSDPVKRKRYDELYERVRTMVGGDVGDRILPRKIVSAEDSLSLFNACFENEQQKAAFLEAGSSFVHRFVIGTKEALKKGRKGLNDIEVPDRFKPAAKMADSAMRVGEQFCGGLAGEATEQPVPLNEAASPKQKKQRNAKSQSSDSEGSDVSDMSDSSVSKREVQLGPKRSLQAIKPKAPSYESESDGSSSDEHRPLLLKKAGSKPAQKEPVVKQNEIPPVLAKKNPDPAPKLAPVPAKRAPVKKGASRAKQHAAGPAQKSQAELPPKHEAPNKAEKAGESNPPQESISNSRILTYLILAGFSGILGYQFFSWRNNKKPKKDDSKTDPAQPLSEAINSAAINSAAINSEAKNAGAAVL